MTTYFAFKVYGQQTTAFRMYANGIKSLGTINAADAPSAVLEVISKYDNENYFANEDNTEVRDCDGNVIWESGDTSANMGDYTYNVYTSADLIDGYNNKELKALMAQDDYLATDEMISYYNGK